MTFRTFPEKFQVAFSFAGKERELVRSIAEEVERLLGEGEVFFDEWYEHVLAGHDADLKLQKIYGHGCELVIICVSDPYSKKPWTLAEHEAIRARVMTSRNTKNSHDRDSVMPVRVGDGEVQGILFNTIAPDVRARSPEESAQLIIRRLGLVKQSTAHETEPSRRDLWPETPISFANGLADRAIREWPAVLQLLSSGATKRILMFEGPSGHSKTALLQAAAKYTKVLSIPVAYVDFKDTKLLSENNVVREIQTSLARVTPNIASQKEIDRWQLRQDLRNLQGSALIILDTYERASVTKELVEWLETHLLSEAEDCASLRFIVAGQEVPKLSAARWHEQAELVELDPIHDQQVWKAWIHETHSHVDDKHIEALVLGLEGVPATISSALRTCAKSLITPPISLNVLPLPK